MNKNALSDYVCAKVITSAHPGRVVCDHVTCREVRPIRSRIFECREQVTRGKSECSTTSLVSDTHPYVPGQAQDINVAF